MSVTQDIIDLVASEDGTDKLAIARALLKESGVSVKDLLALETDADLDAATGPIAVVSGVKVSRDRLKADDAPTPAAPTAAQVRALVTGQAPAWQKKQQAQAAATLGLLPKTLGLTQRQKESVERGPRWTVYRGGREECEICKGTPGADIPAKERRIQKGTRYVYWPMSRTLADGSVLFDTFFFHGRCWEADPQYAAAAGIPQIDPAPLPELKTVKEQMEAERVQVQQQAAPSTTTSADVNALHAAALASVKSPIERMASDLVALGAMAKALGFEQLDANAVNTIAGLAHAMRELNEAFRPSRRTDD